MPCPSQQDFLPTLAKLLSNRHHVGQSLTRMMYGRFEINNWNLRTLCERSENWIGPLRFPILQRRKTPHPNRHAITAQHAHELSDVFSLVRFHHGAFAMLKRPACPAWLKYNRVPPEFVNPNLHRRAGAQTWIEKDQRDRTSSYWFRSVLVTFESRSGFN